MVFVGYLLSNHCSSMGCCTFLSLAFLLLLVIIFIRIVHALHAFFPSHFPSMFSADSQKKKKNLASICFTTIITFFFFPSNITRLEMIFRKPALIHMWLAVACAFIIKLFLYFFFFWGGGVKFCTLHKSVHYLDRHSKDIVRNKESTIICQPALGKIVGHYQASFHIAKVVPANAWHNLMKQIMCNI